MGACSLIRDIVSRKQLHVRSHLPSHPLSPVKGDLCIVPFYYSLSGCRLGQCCEVIHQLNMPYGMSKWAGLSRKVLRPDIPSGGQYYCGVAAMI